MAGEGNEYVTLTVVVRRGDTEGDPCDILLDSPADMMFVGHEDGVTSTPLVLGADPGSWA
ncbi:hypothetical protein [Streptomyces graminilatus]|uniref:hypothetical protein n=1 Tax=Streptomyces graminilatus TaxID=1464070 RepID=UPI0006E3067F|nr:hypothetical protein [Streptomyces graminilatus]